MKEVSHEMEIKKKTPGTIILRVNRISEVKQSLSKLQVLISNDTNLQLSTQVHDVKKLYAELKAGDSSHEWQQAYFYNTHDMPDDNITFSLHEVTADGPNEEPLSRVTRHNLSNLIDPHADSPLQDTIEFRSKGGDLLALLSLTLEFFIRKDIIAGLEMPKIDLTPPQGFKPLYNAVDLYRPPSKVEGTEKLTAAQKYNCFNFFDGDEIPGFDQIDVFPAKFKEVNRRDKQKTGIFSVWEE